MEGVEDIPGSALSEGMTWDWETFPEYLDALDQRRWTVDVGTQIAHGAVRSYVMGERGARNEPATPEDIAAMKQVVKEAIAAGALGFSTSRTIAHRAIDGEPVPGTYAAEDELFGIGAALGELGTGIFELAPAGTAGEDILAPKQEVDWMRRLSAAIQRPVTFAMVQVDAAPDLWRELLDESLRAEADGADLWPQVAGRGFGLLSGHFTTYCLLDQIPAYQELKAKDLSPDDLVAALRTARGARRRSSRGSRTPRRPSGWSRPTQTTYILGSPPEYEPGPERSLAGIAAATGRSAAVGGLRRHARGRRPGPAVRADPQLLRRQPARRPGDAPPPPGRGRPRRRRAPTAGSSATRPSPPSCSPTGPGTGTGARRLPLEWMVKKQTHDTARLYGLTDRGTIEAGALADINLIDYDRLQLDQPPGGRRPARRRASACSRARSATSRPSSPG